MPSWNDGETFSEGRLSLLSSGSMDRGYTLDTIEDPSFWGLAPDSNLFCFVHKEVPERFVAFGGTNTGRRFLASAVKNEVENCGFVSWIYPKWPDSLQHALCSLWAKVDETNAARIEEKIDHAHLIKNLDADDADNGKAEKKYSSLIDEVNKFVEETVAKVRQETYEKMKKEAEVEDQLLGLSQFARVELEEELEKVEKERNKLMLELHDVVKENNSVKQQVLQLKEAHKHDRDMLIMVQKQREDEREAMKEEKKKLEYMLYDMVKAKDVNKEKLKRIGKILDE
ncbi:unnamed protein product [Alopecurus aequalis]